MVSMAMTLRLDEVETEALRVTAQRENRSMQDVAREAIVRYTGERDRLRTEALRQIALEWRETFDRLAQT